MIGLRHTTHLVSAIPVVISLIAMSAGKAATTQQDSQGPVAEMEKAAERQRSSLCAYSVVRRYTLQNEHLKPSAQMEARLTYERGKGKHFQILSMQATGVARRELNDLLKEELKTEKGQKEDDAVDTSNYRLTLLGEVTCGNQNCYKMQLSPRRKSKYLVDGTAWVSTKGCRIVRIVGRMAASPSFWISRPEVEQRFENVDGFSMPSYNRSTTKVLFFGEAELTIDYSDYQVRSCKDDHGQALP